MKDITDKNFGVIIAFWLPGFILLWGLSFSVPDVSVWLAKSSANDAPSVGGFLYATLASLSLGLMISAVRWLIVDSFLHCTTTLPMIDFSKLKDKDAFAAFQGIVENHYRYYQYYSNTLIAVISAFAVYLVHGKEKPSWQLWVGVVVLIVILLLASRDSLKKYHERASAIAT
jgi:hypothetical protein